MEYVSHKQDIKHDMMHCYNSNFNLDVFVDLI